MDSGFAYNGYGDRVQQRVNGVTTDYLLDLNASLIQVLAEYGAGDPTYYLHGLDIIGQQQGGQWQYFGGDALGSNRFMMDANAAISYMADYDPYGAPIGIYNNSSVTSALGFTGEMTDASGLQYLRARYYNPATGTFLSQDPIMGVVGGQSVRWNSYVYAGANPVMYTDPNGEFFWLAVLIGVPLIAGITTAAYDIGITQGFGLGGHNQFDLAALNWDQVANAGSSGFFGSIEAGAATFLWPLYLARGATGMSPYEVNRNILSHFGLDDEYQQLHENPYYIAGKGGGRAGFMFASALSFGHAVSNASVSWKTINMRPPSFPSFAGAGQLAYASGQLAVNVPAIAGAGQLVWTGGRSLTNTIMMFSKKGRGGDDRHDRSERNISQSNQAQNREARAAIQAAERELGFKLSRNQIRRVHDAISGQNLSYDEIIDHIISIFGK